MFEEGGQTERPRRNNNVPLKGNVQLHNNNERGGKRKQ